METYANVPQIILNGPEWFSSMGTERSKGTKVFEDVFAQQAHLPGLADGHLEPLDGDGVLGPDVDVALLRPDGVAGGEVHPGFRPAGPGWRRLPHR